MDNYTECFKAGYETARLGLSSKVDKDGLTDAEVRAWDKGFKAIEESQCYSCSNNADTGGGCTAYSEPGAQCPGFEL